MFRKPKTADEVRKEAEERQKAEEDRRRRPPQRRRPCHIDEDENSNGSWHDAIRASEGD